MKPSERIKEIRDSFKIEYPISNQFDDLIDSIVAIQRYLDEEHERKGKDES